MSSNTAPPPAPHTSPGPRTTEVSEYTCPMHPEIRQPGPGACPICGMALEPVLVTAEAGPSAELRDMTRRFWAALVLSVPVVLLGMGMDLVPAMERLITSSMVLTLASAMLREVSSTVAGRDVMAVNIQPMLAYFTHLGPVRRRPP